VVDDAAVQGYSIGWLAIPTMGESWHSNHHAFPASCRHGLYKGQIDLGFEYVRVLARFGLAWNIRTPENLPPRSGLTPVSRRALSAASAGQAQVSGKRT
jgi:stearoyl-CoA desaturase (delta-9 desaturase)